LLQALNNFTLWAVQSKYPYYTTNTWSVIEFCDLILFRKINYMILLWSFEKMEAAGSSKILETTYMITQCCCLKDYSQNFHCYENFRCHISYKCLWYLHVS
jgi:hypothetical protein